MPNKRRKIIFHSKEDLSARGHLKSAEQVFKNFNAEKISDTNDVIELYQIKLYFDNYLFLDSWTEKELANYKSLVKTFWNLIREYWINIDEQIFVTLFNQIDYQFYDSFWSLTDKFKIYKKITPNTINKVFNNSRFNIRSILKQKSLVNHFSKPIKDYLISNDNSAEILLSSFEEEHLSKRPVLHFPSSLNEKDKEMIIVKYLDKPNANLNYVRLAVKSRNIRLSDKTKLKAKKLSQKLNDEIIEEGHSWSNRVQVGIDKDQIEPVKKSFGKNILTYTYSEKWLNETQSQIAVFRNFTNLFKYINHQGCIDLVSKTSEIDSFERTFMRSKNEYLIGTRFQEKSMLSHLQLLIYSHYLEKNKISLESVLSNLVNDFFNNHYLINELKISFPSENSSILEKIRMIVPELEYLLKQYKIYVDEGFIDTELLEFSSGTLYLSALKSKKTNKYAYGKGNEYYRLRYVFFSNQSMLYYVDPHKEKYQNLYQLLTNENIKYDNFQDYQKTEIDYLLSQEHLKIDKENFIRIHNDDLVFIIGILYHEDVISFWHYPESIRTQILSLEKAGIVHFENTLFTIDERKYLNFYLNQKEFTNGLDLRNKYLHGTNTTSIEEQQNDYQILLKLLILIIAKIKDDLMIEMIKKNW